MGKTFVNPFDLVRREQDDHQSVQGATEETLSSTTSSLASLSLTYQASAPHQLQLSLKRILKRDIKTRLAGFSELGKHLSLATDEWLQEILAGLVDMFGMTENEEQEEETKIALFELLDQVIRDRGVIVLGKIDMFILMGSMGHPSKDVQRIAQRSMLHALGCNSQKLPARFWEQLLPIVVVSEESLWNRAKVELMTRAPLKTIYALTVTSLLVKYSPNTITDYLELELVLDSLKRFPSLNKHPEVRSSAYLLAKNLVTEACNHKFTIWCIEQASKDVHPISANQAIVLLLEATKKGLWIMEETFLQDTALKYSASSYANLEPLLLKCGERNGFAVAPLFRASVEQKIDSFDPATSFAILRLLIALDKEHMVDALFSGQTPFAFRLAWHEVLDLLKKAQIEYHEDMLALFVKAKGAQLGERDENLCILASSVLDGLKRAPIEQLDLSQAILDFVMLDSKDENTEQLLDSMDMGLKAIKFNSALNIRASSSSIAMVYDKLMPWSGNDHAWIISQIHDKKAQNVVYKGIISRQGPIDHHPIANDMDFWNYCIANSQLIMANSTLDSHLFRLAWNYEMIEYVQWRCQDDQGEIKLPSFVDKLDLAFNPALGKVSWALFERHAIHGHPLSIPELVYPIFRERYIRPTTDKLSQTVLQTYFFNDKVVSPSSLLSYIRPLEDRAALHLMNMIYKHFDLGHNLYSFITIFGLMQNEPLSEKSFEDISIPDDSIVPSNLSSSLLIHSLKHHERFVSDPLKPFLKQVLSDLTIKEEFAFPAPLFVHHHGGDSIPEMLTQNWLRHLLFLVPEAKTCEGANLEEYHVRLSQWTISEWRQLFDQKNTNVVDADFLKTLCILNLACRYKHPPLRLTTDIVLQLINRLHNAVNSNQQLKTEWFKLLRHLFVQRPDIDGHFWESLDREDARVFWKPLSQEPLMWNALATISSRCSLPSCIEQELLESLWNRWLNEHDPSLAYVARIQALKHLADGTLDCQNSRLFPVKDPLAARYMLGILMDKLLLMIKSADNFDASSLFDLIKVQQLIDQGHSLIACDMILTLAEGAREEHLVYTNLYTVFKDRFANQLLRVLLMDNLLGVNFDPSEHEISHTDPEQLDKDDPGSLSLLAAHCYLRLLKSFPSACRAWVDSLSDNDKDCVIAYTQAHFSQLLITRELARIKRHQRQQEEIKQAKLHEALSKSKAADVRAKKMFLEKELSAGLSLSTSRSSTTCTVHASYRVEEASFALILTVPPSFPLTPIRVEQDFHSRASLPMTKWKAWLLACQSVFSSHFFNGSILEGLLLFAKNIEASLASADPCPICYCVLHPGDRTMPGPGCPTCHKKFHASCLARWFKSSAGGGGSSTCPMCRSLF